MSNSARISPTAHYTGYVWQHAGWSDPCLATALGRALYWGLAPAMRASELLGGPTLEHMLLARHCLIDSQLHAAIANGSVQQVVEIAAGLSPRGLRFARQYGSALSYIEAELPAMAALKRQRLAGQLSSHHQVVEVDALAPSGPGSLAALLATLDCSKGIAIITEGLINYFPQAAVLTLWQHIATGLQGFKQGLYLSDIHTRTDNDSPLVHSAITALSLFVRGSVHLHFDSDADAVQQLGQAGFSEAALLRPHDFAKALPLCSAHGAALVRVIRATTAGR